MAINPSVSLGVLDDQLRLCNAQAIPVDGAADYSASCINMLKTVPSFGVGTPLCIKVKITTAFGKSAGSPYLTIKPVVDSVSGLSSASPISDGISLLDGDGTAGKVYDIPLPMGPINAREKFLGLILTPSTTQFTAGNISAWLATQ